MKDQRSLNRLFCPAFTSSGGSLLSSAASANWVDAISCIKGLLIAPFSALLLFVVMLYASTMASSSGYSSSLESNCMNLSSSPSEELDDEESDPS